VSDVFDALTQERPYRKALTPDDALVALEREASQGRIDGDVVQLLIQARRSPT
jgi:putative two-component system response regulator